MENVQTSSLAARRPYRSHKIRACDYCRKRKQRCLVEIIGQPCHLCQLQGAQCRYTEGCDPPSAFPKAGSDMRAKPYPARPALKRPYRPCSPNGENSPALQSASVGPHASHSEEPKLYGIVPASDAPHQSNHIVGPVVSEDAHVLEQYMSPGLVEGGRATENPYSVYSADPKMPVLYTKVDRRRQGLPVSQDAGTRQREIMDQILAPDSRRLLDLYLEKVHPCFPVVDERLLMTKSSEDCGCSAALLCELYAITLSYWSQGDVAISRPRPDQRFAWNLAVTALQEDFLAPSITTLQATLVDLTGRPTYSLTGNVVNNGRSVAIAYSLGLNRDPKQWNISEDEKNFRIRLWWGVLIHDTWGSLAHGTPPNVSPNHYDVPVPTVENLTPLCGKRTQQQTSKCFIALCQLTEILAEVLPSAYNLRGIPQRDTRKVVRAVETSLDQWEDALPKFLNPILKSDSSVSGSSNLHLGLLSLKMLICRITLHAASRDAEDTTAEALSYYQAECRESALAVVTYISTLKDFHLAEFWLPYSAYYLTSATTLLLRFAVETTNDNVAASCVSSVKNFTRYLRDVRDAYDWDLGDHCLKQCEGIISRMIHNGRMPGPGVEENNSIPPIPFFDPDGPLNWFDSSMSTSFGLVGAGHARDIWDMFGMDGQNL